MNDPTTYDFMIEADVLVYAAKYGQGRTLMEVVEDPTMTGIKVRVEGNQRICSPRAIQAFREAIREQSLKN
jgi:hypothetical protein